MSACMPTIVLQGLGAAVAGHRTAHHQRLEWRRREPRRGFQHPVGHAQRGDGRHEDAEARVAEAQGGEPQAKSTKGMGKSFESAQKRS